MKNYVKEKEKKQLKLKKRDKIDRIMTEKNDSFFEPKKYTEIIKKHTVHEEVYDFREL